MADPFADLPDKVYRAPTVMDPFADMPDKVFRVAPSRKAPSGSIASGVLSEVAQGATFNTADEMRAAVQATRRRLTGDAGDWKSAFDEELGKAQGALHAFQEAHPGLALGSNIAGSVVTPAMGAVGPAKSLLQAGLRAGGAGVASGALSGAGAAEGGIGNRATGAAIGGVAGGVLGAGAGMAIKGAGGLTGLFPGGGARRQGQALLRNAIEAEGTTADELGSRIAAANQTGVTGVTAGDVATAGPVRALAEDVIHHPSTAQGKYTGMLQERQAGKMTIKGPVGDQGSAAELDVRRAVGLQRQRAYATAQQLQAERKASAQKLFGQARQFDPSQDPNIGMVWRDVVDSDAGEGALNATRRLWKNRYPKQPFPLDGERNLSAVPNMEVMQLFKEGLDDEVSKLYRAGQNAVAGSAKALRDRFRDALVQANPIYGKALQQYAGDTALQEALENGRKFLKTSADEVEDALSKLTPGEQEQYRIGAVTALFDGRKVGPTVDYTGPLLKDRDNFRRIMALVPDDQGRELLLQQLTTRQQMAGLASRTANSATSRRQETARMMEGGGGPREIPLTAAGIAKLVFDRTVGKAKDVATRARRAEVGNLLMQQDSSALQALQKLNMGANGPETAAARVGVPAGATTGGIAGRMLQQPAPMPSPGLLGQPDEEETRRRWGELNAGNGAALRIR